MYETTAFLYERIAAFENPAQVSKDIRDALQNLEISPPGTLGDLGAGTGLMSVLLAELGWQVHGLELSEAMIAVARENAARLPGLVQSRLAWSQGDISTFTLPAGVLWDGAVCLHNTVNHLVTLEQVEKFAGCVFAALKPGGALIMDSDTVFSFREFFDHEPTVVWDDGHHRVTRSCRFDRETGRARHVAVLEQHGPDGWQRQSEEHLELQYHEEESLRAVFAEAGFLLAGASPYNPNPKLYQGDIIPKVLWVFRKPSAD